MNYQLTQQSLNNLLTAALTATLQGKFETLDDFKLSSLAECKKIPLLDRESTEKTIKEIFQKGYLIKLLKFAVEAKCEILLELLIDLLQKDPDITATLLAHTEGNGDSLLHYFARNQNIIMAVFLVSKGASLLTTYHIAESALFNFSEDNRIQLILAIHASTHIDATLKDKIIIEVIAQYFDYACAKRFCTQSFLQTVVNLQLAEPDIITVLSYVAKTILYLQNKNVAIFDDGNSEANYYVSQLDRTSRIKLLIALTYCQDQEFFPLLKKIMLQRRISTENNKDKSSSDIHCIMDNTGKSEAQLLVIEWLQEAKLITAIDIENKNGYSELARAIEDGEGLVIEKLITLNAKVAHINRQKKSILELLCSTPREKWEKLECVPFSVFESLFQKVIERNELLKVLLLAAQNGHFILFWFAFRFIFNRPFSSQDETIILGVLSIANSEFKLAMMSYIVHWNAKPLFKFMIRQNIFTINKQENIIAALKECLDPYIEKSCALQENPKDKRAVLENILEEARLIQETDEANLPSYYIGFLQLGIPVEGLQLIFLLNFRDTNLAIVHNGFTLEEKDLKKQVLITCDVYGLANPEIIKILIYKIIIDYIDQLLLQEKQKEATHTQCITNPSVTENETSNTDSKIVAIPVVTRSKADNSNSEIVGNLSATANKTSQSDCKIVANSPVSEDESIMLKQEIARLKQEKEQVMRDKQNLLRKLHAQAEQLCDAEEQRDLLQSRGQRPDNFTPFLAIAREANLVQMESGYKPIMIIDSHCAPDFLHLYIKRVPSELRDAIKNVIPNLDLLFFECANRLYNLCHTDNKQLVIAFLAHYTSQDRIQKNIAIINADILFLILLATRPQALIIYQAYGMSYTRNFFFTKLPDGRCLHQAIDSDIAVETLMQLFAAIRSDYNPDHIDAGKLIPFTTKDSAKVSLLWEKLQATLTETKTSPAVTLTSSAKQLTSTNQLKLELPSDREQNADPVVKPEEINHASNPTLFGTPLPPPAALPVSSLNSPDLSFDQPTSNKRSLPDTTETTTSNASGLDGNSSEISRSKILRSTPSG